MQSKAVIDDFMAQPTLAVVGVSRSKEKFGSYIFRELKTRGYKIFPVNPKVDKIDEETCYPDLKSLPEKPGGVVVVVPPAQSEQVVREAKEAGIERVWLQQGAESKAAMKYCQEQGMKVVDGECIMMFAKPYGFHGIHRWIWGLLGKLPK